MTDSVWTAQELRLRRVRDRLHDARLDGLLVSHLPNVHYLSGFSGSSGLMLVEPGVASLFTDFRYRTQARDEIADGISVSIAEDDLFTALAARLAEGEGGRRLGFEDASISVRDRRALGENCGNVVWEPAGGLLGELRARKDSDEISRVERAVAIAEAGLEAALKVVEEGVSERDLVAELEYRLRLAGSEASPFASIVASGPRTALPHVRPGERKLIEGDLVLFDLGAVTGGYCSDITRTFTLGPAAPWQRELHAAVREASERAVAAVAPGVKASHVDAAARRFLEGVGLGEQFGHGTGHGVGLEVHESPRINRRSRELLEAGNVVTIEPGVYLPERGGVRIEEVVVVEEGGARVLSSFTRDLAAL